MFRWIVFLPLLVIITGCVVPISSSCMDAKKFEHPESGRPPKTSKCDATDAAMYILAATLKSVDKEDIFPPKKNNKAKKCSKLVGKAQKECTKQLQEHFDPLDEFE